MKEYKENIKKKLSKLTGHAATVAKAMIAYDKCKYYNSKEELANIRLALLKDNPASMAEMYDISLREIFETVHNKQVADWIGMVYGRLNNYVHSPSSYRRSFRTKNIALRIPQICHSVYFNWESFDILVDLKKPRSYSYDSLIHTFLYGDLLAVRIDQGDVEIIDAIKEICTGDNNTKLLNDDIINGIVKSSNAELHKLLGEMLLAAKLQEGLRQSILENADNGRIEVLIYLMKIVIDNNLLRYSSAFRAICVWMGLGYEFDDKRVMTKLLKLGYEYLTNEKLRKTALTSKDVIEIYASLWATSAYEMNDTMPLIDKLMAGEKYQKLVAMSFVTQIENNELQFNIASKHLDQTDLDVLGYVFENYDISCGWNENKKDFIEVCKQYEFLKDKELRDKHFEQILKIAPCIPKEGHSIEGKPFDWSDLRFTRGTIFARLMVLAGYDMDSQKIDTLIDHIEYCDSDNRLTFVRFFIDEPQNTKQREFLFASLSDKSMPIRSYALDNIKKLEITEAEISQVLNLMTLKTNDIRQKAVEIILTLSKDRATLAVKTLLADKVENKRLAGLDLLGQLIKKGDLKRVQAADYIALMPKITDKERLLVDELQDNEMKYSADNGYGLYDPSYIPIFAPLKIDKKHTMSSVFDFSLERMKKLVDSLIEIIDQNKDYTYKAKAYYDSIEDVVLGTMTLPQARIEVDEEQCDGFQASDLDSFVLPHVWRAWLKENKVTFEEILVFKFASIVKDYNGTYEPDYLDWANAIIEKQFQAKKVDQLIRYYNKKKKYGSLAFHLLCIMRTEFTEKERFDVLSGALIDLMQQVPEEDWRKVADEDTNRYNWCRDKFADSDEVSMLLYGLKWIANTDIFFEKYVAICYEIARLEGLMCKKLSEKDIARAIDLGILKIDALYQIFFCGNNTSVLGYYTHPIQHRHTHNREEVEKYPILKKVADEVAARVIEIELKRGDSRTEVSELASKINWHEGATTFAQILVALGEETFVRGYRGYIYNNMYNNYTKKSTLSGLLKVCHPSAADTAETLRAAIDGRIDDKRLIEAAMYSPSWLKIVSEYLGWTGMECAAWYFHAHSNESFSAEKETEVARYSPITPEEFKDGAFDINWFKEAYNTLGAERFETMYDCAKYITEGGNHRRSQLFADACLGKLKLSELQKEITDKRNKDKLLSYSIVPLNSKKKQEDALARYEFIQEFLKQSKTFGAQRRESEAKVSAIALDNLARNAGYADALRFSWRMETLKIDQIKHFFEPKLCDDVAVKIAIGEDGVAVLVCEKEGKALASVPAKLKKDPYIAECKEMIAALKKQFKRTRSSLEQSMVNRDTFEFVELKLLMNHPVIAPLLQKLLFVSDARVGAFYELSELPDTAIVSIAHPYDLYKSGEWLRYQRYAFEHKFFQPFKQIFRELYLVNEDELAEKTISRRYAGHQVQTQKTAALLKGRGWTVDYDSGLQRVYYRENIIATMYAAADWFSPADVEAPTLETVQFFDRRTYKALPLDSIPPVIFSEVMRDIDLVVSVAHVGGVDPEASHSTIEMRAVIVAELVSLLRIENVELRERHAIVKGSLGEYTVHLGSGVVHKMGKGALNILAVQSQQRGRIFLPFADEDPRTAEIMSKIILLAEDSKIKDTAILSQL